jgi:hypothetical protein
MAVAITNTGGDIAGVAASGNVATYSGVSIGATAADRVVVVCIGTELTSSVPTAVTIDYGTGALAMSARQSATQGAVNSHIFSLPAPTGTTATIAVTFGGTNPTGAQNKIAVFRVTGGFELPGVGSVADTDADPISSGAITIPTSGGCIAICADATNGTARTWTGITEDLDVDTTAFRFSTGISTTAGTPTITVSGGNGEDGALSWVIFGLAPSMNAFRIYANGTEAGAVAHAAQNTNAEFNADRFDSGHIRVRIQNNGLANPSTDDWTLQFSKNGGAYVDYSDSTDIACFNGVGGLTDQAATTNRLTGGTGSFVAGKQGSGDATIENLAITANNFTELVYGWMGVPDVGFCIEGDDYDFRVLLNGVPITYNVVPRLTARRQGLSQDAFRFYNDDEVGADNNDSTPIAAQNTNIVHNTTSTPNIHIQFRIQETNNWSETQAITPADDHKTLELCVSKNGGAYHALASGNTEWIATGTGSTLADGGATTNRLGAGTGSFQAGQQIEFQGGGNLSIFNIIYPALGYTEHVFAITAQADAKVNGETWDFRLINNNVVSDIVVHTQTPRLTVTGGTDPARPNNQKDWPSSPGHQFPVLLRSWTQNLLSTTLKPVVFTVGEQVTALSPRGHQYPTQLRTWTLSLQQTTLAPVPSIPAGNQIYELTDRGLLQPLRSWTWNYNPNLIAQDEMTVGDRRTELSPRAYPEPATRTWTFSYNLNLIGQDRMTVGDRHTDLPNRGPIQPLRSWTWSYNLNLIAQDEMVVGATRTELPPFGPLQPLRSWALSLQQTTLAPIEFTVGVQHYDRLDTGPLQPPRSWTLSLQQTTLAPAAPTPFAQFDWPNPYGPRQPLRSWTFSYNLNLIGQDVVPGQQRVDLPPSGSRQPLRSWTFSYNLNLIGQDQLPVGDHFTVLPPRGHIHPNSLRTWIQSVNLALTTEAGTIPFNQYNWPNPRGYIQPIRSWTAFYNRNLIGQDKFPAGDHLYALSPRGHIQPSDQRTWIGRTLRLLASVQPIGSRVTAVPLSVRQPVRTWINVQNPNLAAQALPVGMVWTQLPSGAFPRDIGNRAWNSQVQPVSGFNRNSTFFVVM